MEPVGSGCNCWDSCGLTRGRNSQGCVCTCFGNGGISESRVTLTLLSCLILSRSLFFFFNEMQCVRDRGGDANPENYSEEPAVSETKHRDLSTRIIPPLVLGGCGSSEEEYFWTFIRMNAEMNFRPISEWLGRRGCLIWSNIWAIEINCD